MDVDLVVEVEVEEVEVEEVEVEVESDDSCEGNPDPVPLPAPELKDAEPEACSSVDCYEPGSLGSAPTPSLTQPQPMVDCQGSVLDKGQSVCIQWNAGFTSLAYAERAIVEDGAALKVCVILAVRVMRNGHLQQEACLVEPR